MRVHGILCLLTLCASRTMAAETPPSSEKFIAQGVQEMFQVGFVRGKRQIQESQRLYDSLRDASGSSSKVDYAHGLVSLRQLNNKDAQFDFLAATKRPGTPYLPAWEALIWSHFVAREYDIAYERLLEFVKLVQRSEDLTEDVRLDEFHWIGRIMAAAERTSQSVRHREKWTHSEKRLTDLLGGDAIDAYRGGKEEMNIRHELLEEEARQAQERFQEKKEAQRQKKLARVGKSVEAVDVKQEALQKSATELKEMLDEQSEEFKKQMERSEKDYTFLERRATMLTSAMLAIDQEMIALQFLNGSRTSNAARDRALLQMQSTRANYELEYMRIVGLAQQNLANTQMLNAQKGQLNNQYNEATGELVNNEAEIKEQKERLQKQASQLKKDKTEFKPPAAAKKNEAARSFRSYIDLDLFAERDKVLDSFGVKLGEK